MCIRRIGFDLQNMIEGFHCLVILPQCAVAIAYVGSSVYAVGEQGKNALEVEDCREVVAFLAFQRPSQDHHLAFNDLVSMNSRRAI